LPQRLDPLSILYYGFDLEPVADDAGVGKQALVIGGAESSNAINVEIREGGAKSRTLLEDRQPGQPGLIYFEDKPLEEHPLLGRRKTVLGIMVEAVEWMAGRNPAICGTHFTTRGN
jgi:hypothetical protein